MAATLFANQTCGGPRFHPISPDQGRCQAGSPLHPRHPVASLPRVWAVLAVLRALPQLGFHRPGVNEMVQCISHLLLSICSVVTHTFSNVENKEIVQVSQFNLCKKAMTVLGHN
jgi:hypothetical protein